MSEDQNGGNVMERLTKLINGVIVYVGTDNPYPTGQIPCEVSPQGVREIMEHLAAYEETGLTPEQCENAKAIIESAFSDDTSKAERIRELLKADRAGRLVVLPFTSGRTLLCKENIDSPRLMKDVELAIRYCSSCGIVFHMDYNVFCDLVKQRRITAVSEEAEKVLGAMKDE